MLLLLMRLVMESIWPSALAMELLTWRISEISMLASATDEAIRSDRAVRVSTVARRVSILDIFKDEMLDRETGKERQVAGVFFLSLELYWELKPLFVYHSCTLVSTLVCRKLAHGVQVFQRGRTAQTWSFKYSNELKCLFFGIWSRLTVVALKMTVFVTMYILHLGQRTITVRHTRLFTRNLDGPLSSPYLKRKWSSRSHQSSLLKVLENREKRQGETNFYNLQMNFLSIQANGYWSQINISWVQPIDWSPPTSTVLDTTC